MDVIEEIMVVKIKPSSYHGVNKTHEGVKFSLGELSAVCTSSAGNNDATVRLKKPLFSKKDQPIAMKC